MRVYEFMLPKKEGLKFTRHFDRWSFEFKGHRIVFTFNSSKHYVDFSTPWEWVNVGTDRYVCGVPNAKIDLLSPNSKNVRKELKRLLCA